MKFERYYSRTCSFIVKKFEICSFLTDRTAMKLTFLERMESTYIYYSHWVTGQYYAKDCGLRELIIINIL